MAAVELPTRRRTRTFTPSPLLIDRCWQFSPLIFVATVVLRWFEPGRFIGTGDVAPLIRNGLAAESGSFWNHQMSGAGATTADAGRVVEVFLIRIAGVLGGDELLAQRMMFVGVMVFACFGVSHLARVVLDSRVAIAVAGLIGVFNPFVLLQLPNLIFPLAIGILGAVLGELLASLQERSTSVTRLVAVSLPVTFLSVNPPLVAVIAGAVLATFGVAIAVVRPTWRDVRTSIRAVPVIVAIHAFWIVPAVLVYGRGADGVSFAAVTDAQAWSWVYAENRLDRVATLTAHWGWFSAEYFPWSARLDQAPWSIMRWALPVGAFLGGIGAVAEKRRFGHLLLGLALVLIVVSQGLHAPFGGLNQVLYDYVPGWWLFRDPISKFGPILVVVYALLLGLLIDRAAHISPRSAGSAVAMPCVALLAVASIAHPWPLINGDVIASDRSSLPPSHVAVPDEWDDLATMVSSSTNDGKVAVLPLNDYYQVTTTWGYHGVDLINQFFDRPVLQRLPGGYFGEVRGYDDLLEAVESTLLAGESDAANRSLDALGASHLVIRRDIMDPAIDPERFRAGAEQIEGLELVASNDVAWLFVRPEARSVRVESYTVGAVDGTEALAVGRGLGAVVDPLATSDRLLWTAASDGSVDMSLAGSELVVTFDEPERIDVSFHRVGEMIEGRLVDRVTLEGVEVSSGVVLDLDPGGEVVDAIGIGDATVPFVDGMVTTIVSGETVELLRERRVDVQNPGVLSDCNRKDERTIEELDFAEERSLTSIALSTDLHSACVAFTIEPADEPAQLLLTTEALAGAPARICGWSEEQQKCVIDAVFVDRAPTRSIFELTAQDRSHGIDLFVYADGEANERTVSRYSDIELVKFEPLDQQPFDVANALSGVRTTQVVQSLEVDVARTDLLEPFGSVGDCHKVDDASAEEVGLGGEIGDATVSLWARAHTACVDARISAPAGETLLVSFDHLSNNDVLPRFCIWQSTVEACADAPVVEEGLRYRAEIETDPAATGLFMFLYADGRPDNTTVTFDAISVVRSDAPRVLIEVAGLGERRAPTVLTADRKPSEINIELSDVTDPFVLIIPESYAPGWELDGLPAGWTAEHLSVDGYANGWRIVPQSGRQAAELTASYKPAELVAKANKFSLGSLAGVCLFGLTSRTRTRRGSPGRTRMQ